MRPNTERPITVEQGTNQLCSVENLESRFFDLISGKKYKHVVPDLWDGHTADRVTKHIKSILGL